MAGRIAIFASARVAPGSRRSTDQMIVKTPLGRFLACNPFPRGWTDGLFYREKMRAIHRAPPAAIDANARILEIGGGRSGMASYLYRVPNITTLAIDPVLIR